MVDFNEIKFKGKIQDYSALKAGLKRSDLNGDVNLQSIFDAIDTANANGVKDGVLDANEVKSFMQKIVDFAKGGKDDELSSKEANKFLQSLGLTNVDETNLFGLLNTFQAQSKNIKQTTTNTQTGSNQIEYTDGHTEEIFQDGSKILTVKNGNKTTVTKQDKDGKIISKTETSVENGVETVIEYENETPKSKTVTDTNNHTISNYKVENGEEILVQEENTQTGDITTYQESVKTITKKDGTVIVDDGNGTITTTSSDGNTVTVKSNKATVTTIKSPTDNTETITTTDNIGTTRVLNKKDGKNISQTVTKDGKSYSVEYDGNGNTKGVIVQNGESPTVIAKKFGCSVEDLIATNPKAIEGKAPNQYFLVGAAIVIPGEMDAEKFAQLNSERDITSKAVGEYATQIESEDAELAARKEHKRTILVQKCNTFEECALAYYKLEGVTNPTKRQIELRVNELKELNPNLKDGEIKGKKITATFSPETDAKISAEKQKKEAKQMAEKQKAEFEAGKTMAQVMYNAIDDHIGGVSEKDFQDNLNKVNADNVVGLLKQYNEISPDTTLIKAIMDETWNNLSTRRNAINKIINALIQRAENANISDERQKQSIEACKKELNSYWSLGIGYCDTAKLESLINNLIGTIDTAEALTKEEKSQIQGNGVDETLGLMNNQLAENTSALNTQLAEDGWCADLYEGLKWCVRSNNLDENIKADLKEYEGYIKELQNAGQAGGEDGFKAKFKEIFGVDYDPNLMKGYNKLQSNFAMAQGLTMQKEGFYSEFSSCINGQENYSSMRTKYGQYLVQLAQAEGQNIEAESAVDTVISAELQKLGLNINTATEAEKRQALKTVISNTYKAIDEELNKYTLGRSLENMEKQLKNAASGVFGNKNDIAFRVNDYIASQQQGGAAVNMAVKAVGSIAIGVATGGVGFAALTTAAVATATVSAGVDLTDRASSDVGLKEGEVAEILKNATLDGASVFAGGVVGKYAAMFKNTNAFVQAGGKLSMMVAGDVATGAATEYIQTGTITLEGVTFQAIFSGAGNLVSLKQLAKTDIPTQVSGDSQQVRASRGVKGEVNNNSDVVAGDEVARNVDQSHSHANERRMVEQDLEGVSTPDKPAKSQKENGVETVSEADNSAGGVETKKSVEHSTNTSNTTNTAEVSTNPESMIDRMADENNMSKPLTKEERELLDEEINDIIDKAYDNQLENPEEVLNKIEKVIQNMGDDAPVSMKMLNAIRRKLGIEVSEVAPSLEVKTSVKADAPQEAKLHLNDLIKPNDSPEVRQIKTNMYDKIRSLDIPDDDKKALLNKINDTNISLAEKISADADIDLEKATLVLDWAREDVYKNIAEKMYYDKSISYDTAEKIFMYCRPNNEFFIEHLLADPNMPREKIPFSILYVQGKEEIAKDIVEKYKFSGEKAIRTLANINDDNKEFVPRILNSYFVQDDDISYLIASVNKDNEKFLNYLIKDKVNYSAKDAGKFLKNVNSENENFAKYLLLEKRDLSDNAVDILRVVSKDNERLAKYLLNNSEIPASNSSDILRNVNKDNIDLVENCCRNHKQLGILPEQVVYISNGDFSLEKLQKINQRFGKDTVANFTGNDYKILRDFGDYMDKASISDLSKTEKKDFLMKILINKAAIEDNTLPEFSKIIPTNSSEYEAMIKKITRSLNLEMEPLSQSRLAAFEDNFNELSNSLKTMDLSGLREINLTVSHKEFISEVENLMKDLPPIERAKIQDYFGFRIEDGKLTGYPDVKDINPLDFEISDSRSIEVLNKLKSEIERYRNSNFVTTNDIPELNRMLKNISKDMPELFNQIDGSDNAVNMIKSMQKIRQNPKFETLSPSDQKVLMLSTLLHNTDKISGKASESAFDAYFISKKFGLSDKEAQKLYKIIQTSDAIEQFMNTTKKENKSFIHGRTQREELFDTLAFNLKEGNDFELAQMLYSTKDKTGFTRNLDKILQTRIEQMKATDFILPQTKPETYRQFAKQQTITRGDATYNVAVVNSEDIEDFYAFIHTPEAGYTTGGSRNANFANFEIFKDFADDKVICTSYVGNGKASLVNEFHHGFIFDVANEHQYVGYNRDIWSMAKNLPDMLSEYFSERGIKHYLGTSKYEHRTMISDALKTNLYGEDYRNLSKTFNKNKNRILDKYKQAISNLESQRKLIMQGKVAGGMTQAQYAQLKELPEIKELDTQILQLKRAQKAEIEALPEYQQLQEIDKSYIERMNNLKQQLGTETMSIERLNEIDPEFALAYKKLLEAERSNDQAFLLNAFHHNEVLVSNPKISALYTDDINTIPEEYLKKAQEENIPIVIIQA